MKRKHVGALFHHPGKKSESKAMAGDKQQEVRCSPPRAEGVKQEEEVPLGVRAGEPEGRGQWPKGGAKGRGGACRGRKYILQARARAKTKSPRWLGCSAPQFPHFQVAKKEQQNTSPRMAPRVQWKQRKPTLWMTT